MRLYVLETRSPTSEAETSTGWMNPIDVLWCNNPIISRLSISCVYCCWQSNAPESATDETRCARAPAVSTPLLAAPFCCAGRRADVLAFCRPCGNRRAKTWVFPVATTSSGKRCVPNQSVHPLVIVLPLSLLLIHIQVIISYHLSSSCVVSSVRIKS
jgi:hypothetical protein